jgi:hypothetical protein
MDTINNLYKPKNARLRAIPKEVYDIIIDAQAEQKKKCNCQYSIEQTIYLLIKRVKKQEIK